MSLILVNRKNSYSDFEDVNDTKVAKFLFGEKREDLHDVVTYLIVADGWSSTREYGYFNIDLIPSAPLANIQLIN